MHIYADQINDSYKGDSIYFSACYLTVTINIVLYKHRLFCIKGK